MIRIAIWALMVIPVASLADEQGIAGLTAHDMVDNRTMLDLTPRMKHKLLSNMREQLAATREIIGLIAQEKFNSASSTARSKLGKTDDLKPVYEAANNEDFSQLVLAAGASGNELAKTLQTKDPKKSLLALRKTMGICLQCHNKFRQ